MATANKSLAVGATGSNVNVWATNITTPNFAKIDSAFGTILAVPFASSDVTLTAADLVYAGYSCTGTLGANCVLIFPATFAGFFTIRNACTGAFTLSARTSGGATIVIPQGGTAFVYTDGTDMRFADGLAADGQLVYAVDSGAADAYVITTPFPTPLKAGVTVWWKATNANTTASTLNANGTGATAIKTAQGGADPAAGAIASGGVYASTYDGTVWRTQGLGFVPSSGGTISGNLVVTGNLTVNGTANMAPPGSVIMWAANAAPSTWLECDGAAVSRTTYAALFSAIGTTFGVGDGTTTFNVPDMRGYFARGWDHGRGVDTGRTFGSNQTDEFEAHVHTVNYQIGNLAGGAGGNSAGIAVATFNSGSTGGTETRPLNVALMFIIKT